MNRKATSISISIFASAIIFGAFGAHGLKSMVSIESLKSFGTGVEYQFYVSLFTLILSLNADRFNFKTRPFLLGIWTGLLLFSGSIYGLVLGKMAHLNVGFLGPVTPIGGALLIGFTGVLAYKIWRSKSC